MARLKHEDLTDSEIKELVVCNLVSIRDILNPWLSKYSVLRNSDWRTIKAGIIKLLERSDHLMQRNERVKD